MKSGTAPSKGVTIGSKAIGSSSSPRRHRAYYTQVRLIFAGSCVGAREIDQYKIAETCAACHRLAEPQCLFWIQSLQFGDVRAISALPPKTDVYRKGRHVLKVPSPEVS